MNTHTQSVNKEDQITASGTLVLLDFDGTITTRDTLIEFIRFYRGAGRYWLGLISLAPVLALYALRMMPNWKAKQFFLARFLKGENSDVFRARCREFAKTVLPSLIRLDAQAAIAKHIRNNATIAVVTASAEDWVKPWCDQNGIICLATKLEVKDGRITGKIKGRNCYGDEKVCRVRERFELSSFTQIIAYGDSSGDKEMLAMADERHYKPWR